MGTRITSVIRMFVQMRQEKADRKRTVGLSLRSNRQLPSPSWEQIRPAASCYTWVGGAHMKTLVILASLGMMALLAGVTAAKADPVFMRDGQVCQRASSGYVICRDARDPTGRSAYIAGGRPRYDREWTPEGTTDYYGSYAGDCRRTHSGYVVCR
jgi:hypothetical protein